MWTHVRLRSLVVHHAVSGGVRGALGSLHHAVPADGHGGSEGPQPAGRRLRMQQPRAGHRPLDRGGHQEQPGNPAGRSRTRFIFAFLSL